MFNLINQNFQHMGIDYCKEQANAIASIYSTAQIILGFGIFVFGVFLGKESYIYLYGFSFENSELIWSFSVYSYWFEKHSHASLKIHTYIFSFFG